MLHIGPLHSSEPERVALVVPGNVLDLMFNTWNKSLITSLDACNQLSFKGTQSHSQENVLSSRHLAPSGKITQYPWHAMPVEHMRQMHVNHSSNALACFRIASY